MADTLSYERNLEFVAMAWRLKHKCILIMYCTWSYTFRSAGAILFVNVPATIITSACLGDALNTIPNLSIS